MSVLSRSLSVVLGVGLSLVGLPATAAVCTYDPALHTETCTFSDGGGALPDDCDLNDDQNTWEAMRDGTWGGEDFALVASAMTAQVITRYEGTLSYSDGCARLSEGLSADGLPIAYAGDMPDTIITHMTTHIDTTLNDLGYSGHQWTRWQPSDGSAAAWMGIYAMLEEDLSPAELTYHYGPKTAQMTVLGMSVWYLNLATRTKVHSCIDKIITSPSSWRTAPVCKGFTAASVRLPDSVTYRVGGTVYTWSSSGANSGSRPDWENSKTPWIFAEGAAIIDPYGLVRRTGRSTRRHYLRSLLILHAIGEWSARNVSDGNFLIAPPRI